VLLGPDDLSIDLPNATANVPENSSRRQYRYENPKSRVTTSLSWNSLYGYGQSYKL